MLKNSLMRLGVAYFLILLGIALWVRDIPNQPDAFNTSIPQIIHTNALGDPASFATAANDLVENGWLRSNNDRFFNAWPPGFILLEALIIKIFGINSPVILILQILAAVLFSVVLALLYVNLRTHLQEKFAIALPLLIFAFPVARVFLLQPIGITLGESFAIGFFLICALLTVLSVQRKSYRYAAYAGACLALSAYFRPQFEIFLLALTGWAVLFAISVRFTRLRKLAELEDVKSTLRTVAIILLIAHAITIPWRMYHWINQGSPLWVYTISNTAKNSVLTAEALESVHGGFVAEGGGNLVCRINPASCGDTANAKVLFVKTFLQHPVEWYSIKLNLIGKYWFSSLQNWANVYIEATHTDILVNGVLLFLLIAVSILLFTRKIRSHESWLVLMWLNISLFSSYVLIFTVQQFETRYFYFPKIVGLTMLILVTALYYRCKAEKVAEV